MLYNVLIKETLTRNFEIEADWPREAEEKVKEMYDKQLIVLDADDFSDLVIREENTCK